jgi:hypothetical protein
LTCFALSSEKQVIIDNVMGGWRDFLLLFSTLWVFSAIQSATHPQPVPVTIQPSHELILKADVSSHPAPTAEHSTPPVAFVPVKATAELAAFDSFVHFHTTQIFSLEKNYQLIHTGLSPPSETVLI